MPRARPSTAPKQRLLGRHGGHARWTYTWKKNGLFDPLTDLFSAVLCIHACMHATMSLSSLLLSKHLLCLLMCYLSFTPLAHASARSERCSDARVTRMCRLTPLGTWQGRPTYDPYEALGVPANAPPERIQQAYRVKARVCHPDKLRLTCPSSSQGEGEMHAEPAQPQEDPFVIINAAYEMLRKPDERELFDRNGSGDGGRFARRGSFTARDHNKRTTLQDLFDFFSEGLKLNTDDGDDDEIEDYLFSDSNAFGEDEEDEENEEEGENAGLHFEWDFADLADLL
ncbi:hypothetical protein Esti_000736 [Eimeria stiedai]